MADQKTLEVAMVESIAWSAGPDGPSFSAKVRATNGRDEAFVEAGVDWRTAPRLGQVVPIAWNGDLKIWVVTEF